MVGFGQGWIDVGDGNWKGSGRDCGRFGNLGWRSKSVECGDGLGACVGLYGSRPSLFFLI